MASAKYEILIPQTGRDVAQHALQYVHSAYQTEAGQNGIMAHVDRNREVLVNGQVAPHDVVVLQAEDQPYSDSFVKQLATYIGEVTQQPVTTVSKTGKGGIQVWPIRTSLVS